MRPAAGSQSFAVIALETTGTGVTPLFCGHAHKSEARAERCRAAILLCYPNTLREEDVRIVPAWDGRDRIDSLLKDDNLDEDEVQEDP